MDLGSRKLFFVGHFESWILHPGYVMGSYGVWTLDPVKPFCRRTTFFSHGTCLVPVCIMDEYIVYFISKQTNVDRITHGHTGAQHIGECVLSKRRQHLNSLKLIIILIM